MNVDSNMTLCVALHGARMNGRQATQFLAHSTDAPRAWRFCERIFQLAKLHPSYKRDCSVQ